jgi:putative hydrolase of the HAD superfamily
VGDAVIKAVTFDLWDTIVIDDSDEGERETKGLGTKAKARRDAFVGELVQWAGVSERQAEAGFSYCNEWFNRQWLVEQRTPSIRERLTQGFEYVGFEPTPNFEALIEKFAGMEVETMPMLVPGIKEALEALKGKYRLGIISDAVVTPGVRLREMMTNLGVAHYFEDFVFSDEAGRSKPNRHVFELAARGLDVAVEEIVHIGDREEKDIVGARTLGAHAVLFIGANDRGHAYNTQANVVCDRMVDLPVLIERLAGDAK